MPDPTAGRRKAQRRANRLARVAAAAERDDQGVTHLAAAYDFWRATCKRLPLEERADHRNRLAELLVNDALNDMDAHRVDYTRLEPVA